MWQELYLEQKKTFCFSRLGSSLLKFINIFQKNHKKFFRLGARKFHFLKYKKCLLKNIRNFLLFEFRAGKCAGQPYYSLLLFIYFSSGSCMRNTFILKKLKIPWTSLRGVFSTLSNTKLFAKVVKTESHKLFSQKDPLWIFDRFLITTLSLKKFEDSFPFIFFSQDSHMFHQHWFKIIMLLYC